MSTVNDISEVMYQCFNNSYAIALPRVDLQNMKYCIVLIDMATHHSPHQFLIHAHILFFVWTARLILNGESRLPRDF